MFISLCFARVYEKFKVHSDTVTAQALEDKVNQFINAHMLSNQEMRVGDAETNAAGQLLGI